MTCPEQILSGIQFNVRCLGNAKLHFPYLSTGVPDSPVILWTPSLLPLQPWNASWSLIPTRHLRGREKCYELHFTDAGTGDRKVEWIPQEWQGKQCSSQDRKKEGPTSGASPAGLGIICYDRTPFPDCLSPPTIHTGPPDTHANDPHRTPWPPRASYWT